MILLDWTGDAVPPEGVTLVSDERTLLATLRHWHGRPAPGLLVRGEALCRWAARFAAARGLDTRAAVSARDTLRMLCPESDGAELAILARRLADAGVDLTALTLASPALPAEGEAGGTFWERVAAWLPDVLASLFPDGPWHTPPSPDHAARFLLWLDAGTDEGGTDAEWAEFAPLIQRQVEIWRGRARASGLMDTSPLTRLAYISGISIPGAATQALDKLLLGHAPPEKGVEDAPEENRAASELFPAAIPPRWEARARERWSALVPSLGIAGLRARLAEVPLAPALRTIAAELEADYYSAYPEQLTPTILRDLSAALPAHRLESLRRACPPPAPPPLARNATSAEAIRWFEDAYLPYRLWERRFGDTAAHATIAAAARSFAQWRLATYPAALAGGPGHDALATSEARRLRESRLATPETLTLWVILDGLPFPNADLFRRELCRRESRLTEVRATAVFAPLPTITRFAKPALMNGMPPRNAAEFTDTPEPCFEGARRVTEKDAATVAATAPPGSVLVFSHCQPDKAYHDPPAATAEQRAAGMLEGLVEIILQVVRAVPNDRRLRLVLATDHGRMLSADVPRRTICPPGMRAEGRAAWKEPQESGVQLPPPEWTDSAPCALLNGDRFGVPTDVLVHLDDGAFLESDGRGGRAPYAHGGLWPEEVVCPWIEFARDVVIPRLTARLSGSGRAGAAATLVLAVENPGPTAVRLLRARLWGDGGWSGPEHLVIEDVVGPLSQGECSLALAPWPSPETRLRATLECALLDNGLPFAVECSVEISSETLYRRTLDARDLDF